MATTTNRANRYPAGADVPNVPVDIQNLANDLDNVANIYTGTLGARPTAVATAGHAAANPGSFYYATDTGELFVNIAGTWIKITTEPGVPLGGMIPYAGSGDPADTRYLLADGRALARTGTYAPLFAAISTTYGIGDGSTTFNIPDKRGRASVGQDNMGTAAGAASRLPNSNRVRGQNGGEERHVMTTSEMAAHSHSFGNGTAIQGHPTNLAGSDFRQPNSDYFTTQAATTTAPNGSGTAHNNMQPYEVDNFLIRVK